jgi:hypothetical protein
VICDFAQVRENLLFICSGGITRVVRPSLPAALNLYVAAHLEFGEEDMTRPHQIVLVFNHVDSARSILRTSLAVELALPPHAHPGERLVFPLVWHLPAVDSYGQHDVAIYLNDNEVGRVTLWVQQSVP